jgi:hypothetical protein
MSNLGLNLIRSCEIFHDCAYGSRHAGEPIRCVSEIKTHRGNTANNFKPLFGNPHASLLRLWRMMVEQSHVSEILWDDRYSYPSNPAGGERFQRGANGPFAKFPNSLRILSLYFRKFMSFTPTGREMWWMNGDLTRPVNWLLLHCVQMEWNFFS